MNRDRESAPREGSATQDRGLLEALASLRDVTEEPPAGLVAWVVASVSRPVVRWRGEVRRLVHDRRARVAAASLGGVVVGVTAIALLWRRAARRATA